MCKYIVYAPFAGWLFNKVHLENMPFVLLELRCSLEEIVRVLEDKLISFFILFGAPCTFTMIALLRRRRRPYILQPEL